MKGTKKGGKLRSRLITSLFLFSLAVIACTCLCKKPQNKNRKSRVGILILLLLFVSKAGSFCIPDGFVPFVDFSGEIGKSYIYWPRPVGVGGKWSYEGATISTGIKYYPAKFPVNFQFTLLKGITEVKDYELAYPIYVSGSLGFIPSKKFQWSLEMGTSYLRSFWQAERHSAFSVYSSLARKGKSIDLGTLVGVYWEDFLIWKESELFIAGEITLSKWFICPYLNLALINRLSHDSEWHVREPKKLTGFVSLGFKIEPTRKGFISNLVNKMTALKKVGSM